MEKYTKLIWRVLAIAVTGSIIKEIYTTKMNYKIKEQEMKLQREKYRLERIKLKVKMEKHHKQ